MPRWLRSLVAGVAFLCGCSPQTKPSLLLITLDTVRADHLGSYGSTQGLTPHLDSLAQDSVLFADVTCQVPLTTPSHASILTGLLPQHHGIRNNEDFVLEDSVETMAEKLRDAGYRTAAFIGAFPLDRRYGLDRGFDVYDDGFLGVPGVVERGADEVLGPALRFIRDSAAEQQPFLAFVHLFDAHSPYEPPPPFRERFADDPYGGEIAYLDDALGRFFASLQEEGHLDGLVVSILSDHGEALGEHSENTHGVLLYQPTMKVPWLLRLPSARMKGKTVDFPVGTMDVAPTLLSLLDLPQLKKADGWDLTPHLDGSDSPPERLVYAESLYLHLLLGWAELRSARQGRLKFIEAPYPELYDLADDPGESANLIETRRREWRQLRKELESFRDDVSAKADAASSEVTRRLESLGYVGGGTTRRQGPARDPKDGMDIWREIEAGTTRLSSDPERAHRHFERALELDPGNGLALKSLGDLSLAEGAPERALELYQASLAAGFAHPDLQFALARAEAASGRPDKALELLSALEEREDALLEMGRLELQLGRAEATKARATKVLASRPDSVEALMLLGQSLRALGQLDEAEANLRRGLELSPSSAKLHNELGAVLAGRGAVSEAEASFREAMGLDPEAVEARVNLARLLEGEEAEGLLREAIRLRPDNAAARVELAKRLAERGEIRDADVHIQAALRASPDDPEALFVAARIAELLGRRSEAAGLYRRFLELASPDLAEPKRMAEERLAALTSP